MRHQAAQPDRVDAHAVAWTDAGWLVAGELGRVEVVDPSGLPAGAYTQANSGSRIQAMARRGDEVLVGGILGRIQRVGLDGTPLGPMTVALDSYWVNAIAAGPAGWLVAGNNGRVQLVAPDGAPPYSRKDPGEGPGENATAPAGRCWCGRPSSDPTTRARSIRIPTHR